MSETHFAYRLAGGQHFSGGQNHIGGQYHSSGNINFIQHSYSSPQNATTATAATNPSDECLRSLMLTDPRQDRHRLLRQKDELLPDTCSWVCHDDAFARWWELRAGQDQQNILWLHGDAGKGKTMMMIALTEHISHCMPDSASSHVMAYYFCQSSNASTNHAHAILRGLIYVLVTENEHLKHHVVKQYSILGMKLFETSSALDGLWRLLCEICNDDSLNTVYLLVDALDECDHGLDDFLQLLSRRDLALPSKVRWLVSSRNESRIARILGATPTQISLEQHASRVSHAIERYIDIKIKDPGAVWADEPHTADSIRQYLLTHANGTFLWVWLVCQELYKMDPWENALEEVRKIPSRLEDVYTRMSQRVKQSKAAEYCFALIRAAEIAPRPLSLDEVCYVANLPLQRFQRRNVLEQLIQQCGSFFVVRDNTLSFVHKSALDHFRSPSAAGLFQHSSREAHSTMCQRSFETLLSELRQNMCRLPSPKSFMDEVEPEVVGSSLTTSMQYACRHWGYHFEHASRENVPANTTLLLSLLERFLQKVFIFWIESMALLRDISGGIRILLDVSTRIIALNTASNIVLSMITDGLKFMNEYHYGIEAAPLQLYHAALTFCPTQSFISQNFAFLKDPGISVHPHPYKWSSCMHTLEGHSNSVTAVALSPDDSLVASGSDDETVRIWDLRAGQSLHTLTGHSGLLRALAFSPDGERLASGSMDNTVCIWNVGAGGQPLHTLKGHSAWITSVAFSPDSTQVASGSDDTTVIIWAIATGQMIHRLNGHAHRIAMIAYPSDGTRVISLSADATLNIWDAGTGQSLQTLQGPDFGWIASAALSPDCRQAVSGTEDDSPLRIWDVDTGQVIRMLEGRLSWVRSVQFSSSGKQIVAGTNDMVVRIWDVETGRLRRTFEGHSNSIRSVAFSQSGAHVASASNDFTLRVWDVEGGSESTLDGHSDRITTVALSPDSRLGVSGSNDTTVRIWEVETGRSIRTLAGHTEFVKSVAFSPDSKHVASGSYDMTVCLWCVESGSLLHTWFGHSSWVMTVTISPDGKQVASGSTDTTTRIWDIDSGQPVRTLQGHSRRVVSIAFSPDGKHLASAASDKTIRIWEVATGETIRVYEDMLASTASQLRCAVNWDACSPAKIPWNLVHLSPDSKWLWYPDGNAIWIPPMYRPSAFAALPGCAALATGSGRVVFLQRKK